MTSSRTVVLDTPVLAELMKPRPDLAVLRWTNAQPIGTLGVTAVSLAELTHAMLRMSDLARSIDLRQALNEFVHDDLANRVLPFDDLAADYYAHFAWKREQTDTPIDVVGAQVAATCRAHAVTLATKDAAVYADLGVTTVDPWTAPPPEPVETPALAPPIELDRHGKPIPPRRPGAARGGVGPSRPPRQRRSRRVSATPNRSPVRGVRATDASTRPAAPTGEAAAGTDAQSLARTRRAAERLRRHVALVQQRATAKRPDGTGERPPGAPDAAPATTPQDTGPGRRGARLRGPLVDAAGRAVERTPDGRVRPRKERTPPAERPPKA